MSVGKEGHTVCFVDQDIYNASSRCICCPIGQRCTVSSKCSPRAKSTAECKDSERPVRRQSEYTQHGTQRRQIHESAVLCMYGHTYSKI